MAAAAESIVEEVALNLEEAAEVTRRINTAGVGVLLGGLVVGAAVGFYIGRRWQREKIRAQVFAEAEEDVAKIREYYEAKVVTAGLKPDLEKIIEERGYSTHTNREGQVRPLPAPVPILDEETIRERLAPTEPVLEEAPAVEEDRQHTDIWNYPLEQSQRSPEAPYVIHQNELGETEYAHVTYTYYDKDDVLCDEDDTPVPHGDLVVGQDNLKWGHGSDDIDVVFVRNDKLELDMEICRSHKSYEEEVLGHDASS